MITKWRIELLKLTRSQGSYNPSHFDSNLLLALNLAHLSLYVSLISLWEREILSISLEHFLKVNRVYIVFCFAVPEIGLKASHMLGELYSGFYLVKM